MKHRRTGSYIFFAEFEDEYLIISYYSDFKILDPETNKIKQIYVVSLEFKEDLDLKDIYKSSFDELLRDENTLIFDSEKEACKKFNEILAKYTFTNVILDGINYEE